MNKHTFLILMALLMSATALPISASTSGHELPDVSVIPNAATFPYSDGFESGALGAEWSEYTTEDGRVRVSSDYPYSGTYSLLLDDSVDDGTNSIAAAILTIDLSGQSDVELNFWWREFDDEDDAEDGVFISDDDGSNWYQAYSFNEGSETWGYTAVDIDAKAADNGLTLNDHFQIKLQFYDNSAIDSDGYAIDNVSVQEPPNRLYLPIVLNDAGPPTSAPVLNAIDNPSGNYDYTVSWNAANKANEYTLQEDDNANFSSPTTAYQGMLTSTAISGKDLGTYYYRVKASNEFGESGWSNVESVTVTVPLPDCPQDGPWRGATSQEGGREINFYVEDSPQCEVYDLRIEFKDSCGAERTTVFVSNPPIASNHFSITGEGTTVTGDFSSSNTASGTFSYDEGGCTASGTWTAALNLGANATVYALAVQADGKIVVGGSFTWLRGERRDRLARLNPDGTLDDTFNPGVDNGQVKALAVQTDGKIVVGGTFTELGGETHNGIARLNPDGTLDTGFNPENYEANSVYTLVVQADGKIVVGGYFDRWDGRTRDNIARLNPDGSLDTTFNPGAGSRVYTLALQEDGKILVGVYGYQNYNSRSPIWRVNPDGSRAVLVSATGSMFNTYVYTLVVQADDKILVGGDFSKLDGVARNDIGRLDSNGNLDTSFNPGANLQVYTLVLQSDDKILVGGSFTTLGGEARGRIGRLNSNGTLDNAFNPGAIGTVYALAVQADAKILVGGSFTTLGGETHYYIGRLNSDGTIDTSFP